MPTFKKGDWVRYKTCNRWRIGKVSNIGPRGCGELWGEAEDIIVNIENERDYFFDDSNDLKQWTPKIGEWIVPLFQSEEKFVVLKFKKEHKGTSYEAACEPFIGQLPTHIKEN